MQYVKLPAFWRQNVELRVADCDVLLGIDNRDDKDQVKIKDNIKPSTHPLTLLHHADYHVSHRADFSEKMFSSCGKKIQRSLHITQHQSHSTSKTCRSNSISS